MSEKEVKILNLNNCNKIRCINIPDLKKEQIVVIHSTIATELENKKFFNYEKVKEGELSLPTIDGKVVYIDDELTCDFSVKKIVNGKSEVATAKGYIVLLLD